MTIKLSTLAFLLAMAFIGLAIQWWAKPDKPALIELGKAMLWAALFALFFAIAGGRSLDL